ncbi:hypothetical protein [Rhodovibrio sodomensis]|uniref:hypothetical protein n=1 Tax=Rhodovibrio sodomensis TaxID=1088 RepID=UPI001904E0CC|nr:hypothetical protein [Rhodovibrio sodomensis]
MSGKENLDGQATVHQVQNAYQGDRLPLKHALGIWILGALVGWAVVAGMILALM